MKLSNVPDSSPGPTTERARSGKVVFEPSSLASAAASVHFAKPVDSGPISAYRSAKLRQVTAVSDGLVMTVMPSYAIFELDELDAGGVAEGLLFVLDRARGVADVGLTGAEALEAVAGARTFDRVVEARVGLLECRGDPGRDRLDRRRAGDADRALDGTGRGARRSLHALGRARRSLAGAAALGAAALGAVVAPVPLLQAATSSVAASANPPRRFDVSSVTCVLHSPSAPGRADPDVCSPLRGQRSSPRVNDLCATC